MNQSLCDKDDFLMFYIKWTEAYWSRGIAEI